MRRLLALAASLLLTVSFAACGDDDDDDATAADDTTTTAAAEEEEPAEEETTTTAAAAPASDATVNVASSSVGEILVDAEGFTLYLFTQDTSESSACVDGCAEAWPPLVADGDATAGDGVDASLLGSIDRGDGTMQVSYNGHPLYRYGADAVPGDMVGQAVGDVWFVVDPAGEPVTS